jgi:predicted permease
MTHILADLRYALRALRAKPSYTLVALLSLTLGIGANTTIFSVANGLLLRELPVPHPEQLTRIVRGRHSPLDHQMLRYVRERSTTIDALIGERLTAGVLTSDDGKSERFDGAFVTGDFFHGLAMQPALGQFFVRKDDASTASEPVVVLSHRYWQTRFASDPAIVGKRLRLNDRLFTVVAVAPADFTSSTWGWKPSAWMPFSDYEAFAKRTLETFGGSVYLTARLKPNATRAQADAELNGLAAQLRQADSARYARLEFRALTARGINEEMRQPVSVITAALLMLVSIVLVIACANVANLQLARATGRRQEIGIRLALGASRGRLVQQLLIESFVVATAGAVLGLGAAYVLTTVTARMIPPDIPVALRVSPDMRVVAFAAGLAIVTALVFGLVPALRATRPDLVQSLKDDVGIQGLRRSRLRSSLLVTQIAMGLALLASAALFVRGLTNARSMQPGFVDAGIVNLRMELGSRNYDEARTLAVYSELLARAKALPGVASATLASVILLEGSNSETRVQRSDDQSADRTRMPQVSFNVVGANYFETMGIPLAAGRGISDADIAAKAPVAVITESMAKHLWPDGSAVGKRFRFAGSQGNGFEVVGVSRNVKYYMIGDNARELMFLPVTQMPQDFALQVKSDLPFGVIGPRLEALARELEPSLPMPRAKAMRDDMAIAYLPARIGAALFGSFGVLALVIAMVGIYGVTSYIVAQRTRELGVRAALGAQSRDLVGAGLRDTLRLVGIGVAIGLPLSYAIARGLTSLPILYETSPNDPLVLGSAVAALALVAMLASYLPARRAGRVDPLISLRAR